MMQRRSSRHLVAFSALLVTALLWQSGAYAPVRVAASAVMSEAPDPAPLAAPTTEVGFQATGWKYQQAAWDGGPADFDEPTFDDSGWPTGQAAFGSGGFCSIQSTVNTGWAVNTDLLLRRSVGLAAGTSGVEVHVVVDNDAIAVYWNGTQIGGPNTHENCADLSQPMVFSVPQGLVGTSNTLALRLRDRGNQSYVDVRVLSGAMPNEDAPEAVQARENDGTGGDPVQTFSGAFLYGFTDAAIAGRGPSPVFWRAYNSLDPRVGPMGPGWNHSYAVRLRHPTGSADILFVGPDGNTDLFTRNNDETFSPPPAVYRTLVRNIDGTYVVTEQSRVKWTFDASGSLTSITDRFGNTSTLGYDASGQLTSISDPAGRGSLSLAYTSGLLTSVTDWASPVRTVTYQYDASGRLWKVTDREGKTSTFTYDGTSARIATITDARGNVALTHTYDAQGRVLTQKDARGLVTGEVTTFTYVVNGNGTRVTTVTSPATSFEPSFTPSLEDSYDANGWITQRVLRPSTSETLVESYAYDGTGNRTAVTDPRGATTNFCYDVSSSGGALSSRGNLTRRIDPAPTSGANRPVTLITYDGTDNPTQVVPPRGVASGASVTCATNLSGSINTTYATDLAYDATGAKLVTMTRRFTDPDLGSLTAVTKYEYGDAANPGALTRVIPPRGNTGPSPDYSYATVLIYFATGTKAGLLESVSDPLGNKATYDYDAVGRMTSSVDALGNAVGGVPADHRTDLVYDKEDRTRFVKLPSPAVGGGQLVTESRYDEVGNLTVQIDANGQVTTYAYDNRDGLFQVKESPSPWGNPASPPGDTITTEYAYDPGGNLTRVTRAKGDSANERVVDYAYDGRGLARRETQFSAWPTTTPTLVTTYAYNANGSRSTSLDPLGRTTTLAYDALERLTGIDYSDAATADVTYAYDANGNRTSMVDGTGSSSYTYDELDRLLGATSPGPKTVGYRYDRDGNRTKLIYPDATAVTYSFDKAGRLGSLQDWASRTVSYAYFADGLVQTATNPNGTLSTFSYDNARRLTDIVHSGPLLTIDERHYSLDAVGTVTAVAGGGTATATTTRVSESTSHGQGNGNSDDSYLSADGRFVTYRSAATNLVADDTNGVLDSFVHDRLTGTTIRASLDAAGVQGNAQSDDPAISADGRYVTFRSQASNFVANDTNGTAWDIFVKDLQTGAISRVSTSSSGAQSNGASHDPVISADGRYVAFRSSATNLVAADTNGQQDIFRKDTVSGTTILVSLSSAGVQGDALSDDPQISDDGNLIAFHSDATNLVTGDTNGHRDVFVRDVAAGTTVRVSISTAGAQGNGRSAEVALSGDGTMVAFESDASNLVSGDTNLKTDVFTRVLASGVTTRVSTSGSGAEGNKASNEPALSRTGAVVAFDSLASNLISGDTNNRKDIFTKDLVSGVVTRMSVDNAGTQGNDTSRNSSISADGQTVAFESDSTNLVVTDTNASQDVFVRGPGVDAATYAYDRLYRLTSVAGPDGARIYAYDPVGNRTSKVLGGSPTASTYDRADRITAAGATSITVNAVGNLVTRGSDTFAYDQANRLTSATVAGVTESYAYDGDGVRFSRQVGTGPVTRYVSDLAAGLPVTIDDGTRKYVWGLGLAYAVAGTSLEVYHPDRLGSVRALSDTTGAVVATYRTDEFGIPTGSTGSSGQPFGYTGEPADATGLSYLRARFYDPALGRFLSRDAWAGVVGSPQTLNRFSYVTNNPATYNDPSGRCIQNIPAGALVGTAVEPGGGTLVGGGIGTIVAVGCVIVAVYLGIPILDAVAQGVIDPKRGDAYPPDLYPRGQPTQDLPFPGPIPPPQPNPDLDPHENPSNPLPGPGGRAIGLGVILSIVGRLLFGVNENGEPVRHSMSQVLDQPQPGPSPYALPS